MMYCVVKRHEQPAGYGAIKIKVLLLLLSSAISAKSSANISSSALFSSWFARFMMLSINIMNNKGDNTHPCLDPHFTSNQSVSPSLVLKMNIYRKYKGDGC